MKIQRLNLRPVRLARRPAAAAAGLVLVALLAGCSGATGSSAELPADFPTAVTVADGTVSAAAKKDNAWTASVQLDRDDTRQSVLDQLAEDGFTVIGQSGAHGNDRVYSLANDDYSLRLGVTTVDGNDVLNYTVAKRQPGDDSK
ncbi:hypothetical protein EDF62_1499 [Leucobacter luti]|uniref:Uncharacterized protein n=1 Tax=Leucobacter luti TaxID=340320 RepID=A0A4V3CYB9_9MICO|nr:hypothetical protein [Leucobacter luti]TDP93518.1 hypothetical protein EDF62_1499 [Leucobacter luti]